MRLGWRHLAMLLALVLVVLASLALTQSRRDTTPPEVFAELPERVPAGMPFEVLLSASEPVTYEVTYGDTELKQVTQNLELDLQALAGQRALEVTVTDSAENSSRYSFDIYGVPEVQPLIRSVDTLMAGAPFSARVVWAPPSIKLSEVNISLDGVPLVTYRQGDEIIALGSAPLGSSASERILRVHFVDQFGREVTTEHPIQITPDPRPVQQLHIAPSVLASSTPANKALEAQALEAAYSNSSYKDAPLWTEPFMQPIQGRQTSGYGTPRRYAPGGRVSYHQGADIAADAGTPIAATNDGKVVIADFYPIKGGLVVIDHGAQVFSLYFHQSKILVEVGQMLERGDIIGEVGTTGLSTGPHLHWEMRVNEVATNPLAWVDKVLP